MPSQAKIELVSEVVDQMKQARSVVVADYRGLTVAEMTALRVKLREQGARLQVVKNRLAKIALKDAELPAMDEHLTGPSAFAFSLTDPIAGPKVLAEYAKNNEKLVIKAGLFEGAVMDDQGVKALASMPSREELLGRFVSDLKSPVTKVAMVVKATVNQLAYALQALAEKRTSEA